MRETVHVGLEGRAYDVVIGPDLLAQAGALIAPLLRRKRVVVVSDETVAAHHLDSLRAGLDAADISVEALALPPGEATKCWAELTRTVDWLMDQKVERNDVVIAFGGGVIGDLVGFAAAILRRGVRFVQIPTSLLAQVDSSVGGKTGINVSQGKNLVGAFHQPSLVLADTAVLGTLQARDFLAGYGEVVKYGLLGDAAFFDWLEVNAPAMAALPVETILEKIRQVGLAPTKAKNLKGAAELLVERHGGEVPSDLESLEALPGVGHKTASVVLTQWFGEPAFPVDTHIHRLAARWGLSKAKNVAQTERDLKRLFPSDSWNDLHLQIIYFGREFCPARGHDLLACQICGWAATKKRISQVKRIQKLR